MRLNIFGGNSNGSTLVVGAANILGVISLIILNRQFGLESFLPQIGLNIFVANFAWGIFSLFFGFVTADDYWSWKALLLSHMFTIAIPLAFIVGVHFELFLKVFRFVCYVIFPFGLLMVPYALIDDIQLVPRVVAPVMLLLLFSLYVSTRWRLFFLLVGIVSVGIDLSYRTNLIRFLVTAGLVGLVMLKVRWPFRVWPLIVGALFLIPLLLLTLGITDEFNIFRDNTFSYDVVSRKDKVVNVMEMNVDTRTFLYVEVFNSMLTRGSSFLLGEGGAMGYDSIAFLDADLNGKGRYASEVGFLNILLHQGAIGVALYAAMLIVSSVTALRSSSNTVCMMLGLYLLLRWVLLFIEEQPQFDVINYINWVAMGLCLSNRFRALTDEQLREQISDALKSPFGRN
jgi:hypothetical protein